MMNNYIIEKLVFTISLLVVALSLYFIGKTIAEFSKYTGKKKIYLSFFYAGMIGMLLFYPAAIIAEVYMINFEYLTAMTLVLLPTCVLVFLISILLFLIERKRSKK